MKAAEKEAIPKSTLWNFHDEPWHTPEGRAIREVVFGMNDGLITTLAFVAGVSAAFAESRTVILATLAAVVAGSISMFLGGYLSTKSQQEFFAHEIKREKREIEELPQKEEEEVRQIYRSRGFTEEEVGMIVRRITSDKGLWLKFMMEEELGIGAAQFESPLRSGLVVGLAFGVGAFAPVIPFLIVSGLPALLAALALGVAALFALGAGRAYFTKRFWLWSGLEVVAWGVVAAGAGYGIGFLISQLFGTRVTV